MAFGTAASLGVSCGISMRAGPISAAGKPKSAAEVIHTEDFKRAVLEREGDVLVEVFSPTCTACKALAPRLFAALQLARGSSDVPPLSLVQIVSNWDIDDNEQLPEQVDTPATPRLYLFPHNAKDGAPLQVPMLEQGEEAQHPGLPTVPELLAFAAEHGGQAGLTHATAHTAAVAEMQVRRINWMFEMAAPVAFWVCSTALEELAEADLPPGLTEADRAAATAAFRDLQATTNVLSELILGGATHEDVDAVCAADKFDLDAVDGASGLLLWANRCHFADPESEEYIYAFTSVAQLYGERMLRGEAAVSDAEAR
ncbi:unnamed protein product [Symbiodinium sp. KB8]|nr:unnamed protein product [Symbiodinium sp. KB8]